MSHRKLWQPRRPQLPAQCASCPFHKDNDAEFSVIVNRLRKKEGMKPVVPHSKTVKEARSRVRLELLCLGTGEFLCHGTVYGEDMTIKPMSEHRQCPGAAKFFREL